MRTLLALLLCAAITAPAFAQVRPQPGAGDPRLQTIDYNPGQIVQLEGAPGYQLMVELSPDEQVINVALGDSSAWQVSANHSGDRLFIKPTQGDVPTNMTVITSVRSYNFELWPLSSPTPEMAYNVRFNYPVAAVQSETSEFVDVSPLRRALSRYRISGDKLIRPDTISDDGTHTYISWARSKAIPAVYTISESGEEMLVSGWMRDDVYVIDGIVTKLSFRIDNRSAGAQRLPPKRKR